MAGRKTKVRAARLRSLYCTAILALLLVIGTHAMEGEHHPFKGEGELALPPLSGRFFNPTVSELRIWTSPEGHSVGYLLRLWKSWGGSVEGELVELPQDRPGVPARRLTVSETWATVLHDLQQHSVWELYQPYITTFQCDSDLAMTVESYQYGQYHRVDVITIADFGKSAPDVRAILRYVYRLAAESEQTASVARGPSVGC